MERPKEKWCTEAVEQIRFRPDRNRVRDELMAHIEDRTADLKSRGYTKVEAETRAVAAMGDPVEVGRQLDSVHKPWLGWLWLLSKVLVILCVIVFVWNSLFTWYANYGYKRTMDDGLAAALREDGTQLWEGVTRRSYQELGTVGRVGDFTLTVDKAALCREENGWNYVVTQITVDGFLPWEQPMETRYFWVEDDLGYRYMPWDKPDTWEVRLQKYQGKLEFEAAERTATSWVYTLTFHPEEDIEWFDLRYDLNGQSMTLRVDLTGGEGA